MRLILKSYTIYLLFLLIAFHAFLITKLIFFPFPDLFINPYLTNKGLIPYKQIIDQHTPGLFFFPVNFGTLGLTNEMIARVWLIIITIIIHLLIYFITKSISKDPQKALFANLIFFSWHAFFGGWVLWLDSFSPVFLLIIFFLSYQFINSTKNNYKLLIIIGFLLSVVILLKQTNGLTAIVTFFMLFYFKKDLRVFKYLSIGFFPPLILTTIYLISLGAFFDFLHWGILFNLATYALSSKKGPEYPSLFQMIASYSPILFFFFLKNKKLSILLCAFTLTSMISILDRFDSKNFQPSLPFFAIGSALVFSQFGNLRKFRIYIIIYLLFSSAWIYEAYGKYLHHEVIIYNETTFKYTNRIREYAKENQEIYLFGVEPLQYYLTKTLPAGRWFIFNVPWNMPILEDESIENLKKSKVELIVRDRTFVVDKKPITVFAKKLDKYIEENYVVFDRLDNMEFLRPQKLQNE